MIFGEKGVSLFLQFFQHLVKFSVFNKMDIQYLVLLRLDGAGRSGYTVDKMEHMPYHTIL